MNYYPEEAVRAGRPVVDDVAVWRAAMQRACATGAPHYRRYADARGRVLATLPPCDHPEPCSPEARFVAAHLRLMEARRARGDCRFGCGERGRSPFCPEHK